MSDETTETTTTTTTTPAAAAAATSTPLELTASDHAYIEQIAHTIVDKLAIHLEGVHAKLDALLEKLPAPLREVLQELDPRPGVNALGALVQKLKCWNCGGAGALAPRAGHLASSCKVCGGAGTIDA
jgi:hypothetical protein